MVAPLEPREAYALWLRVLRCHQPHTAQRPLERPGHHLGFARRSPSAIGDPAAPAMILGVVPGARNWQGVFKRPPEGTPKSQSLAIAAHRAGSLTPVHECSLPFRVRYGNNPDSFSVRIGSYPPKPRQWCKYFKYNRYPVLPCSSSTYCLMLPAGAADTERVWDTPASAPQHSMEALHVRTAN